jgi:hypothetical protein
MAWTAPRNWSDGNAVPNGIVTAAMLNTDVRDNLLILSAHTHTGSAGQGASSMSGLTLAALATLTFADQSANPDAAGELQRNGNDLLWYGSSVVNLTAADASAGTASLRSLGTTAVKAAAGNHSHVPGTPNQLITGGGTYVDTDDETTIGTGTVAVQGASEAIAVFAAVSLPTGNSIWTTRLKYTVGGATTVISTIAGRSGGATQPLFAIPASGTAGIITPTSVGTYTIFVTLDRTTTGSTSYTHARTQLYAREVGA